ncbi:hypothetical protein ANN_08184 [Periplaneta americana]|uniref:Mariner Mos1 transposase n=1 Tax=Periplaneta americana TaxID=6978 RepID=A0ABQ8T0N7_PERAM|nr:hypothetical protein ANN_08184 [Periplaneta americana]
MLLPPTGKLLDKGIKLDNLKYQTYKLRKGGYFLIFKIRPDPGQRRKKENMSGQKRTPRHPIHALPMSNSTSFNFLDSYIVDHLWTARELSIEIVLGHQTVWHILKKNLHMRKIVSYNLTEAQKWHRYAIAQLYLQRYHNEGGVFLQCIVAIDDMWTRAYEPEVKGQSNEWHHKGSPRPKNVRHEPSRVKVMLIVAYDISHAVSQDQNVNAAYYQHFLEHNLHPVMRRKCPHFLRDNPPFILYDNARCHVAGTVAELLQR